MGMRRNYGMTTKSDMNASGLLATAISMMRSILSTDLNTSGFGADKIAQVAITVSYAVTENIAPIVVADGNATTAIAAAESALPTLANKVGTQMAMHSGKLFRLRNSSDGNWSKATIVEIIPSGTELAVAGRRIEVNGDRNITFYSDGTYSEVNTTSNKTLWGSYFDSNNPYGVSVVTGNVNVTIVEDNVTGEFNSTSRPTKHWTFKGDRVSLNDGPDLNVTDVNSTIGISLNAAADLNGSKVIISNDSNSSSHSHPDAIVSRSFDTNGTYREFHGDLVYRRGVWSLYNGSTTDYNVTLDGTTTEINISYESNASILINDKNLTITGAEKLQY